MTRQLVRLAYFEFKVTRQVSTGNGAKFLDGERAPGSFFWYELGFGTGEGPSLAETLRHLTGINRRNAIEFVHRERRREMARKKLAQKRDVARKKAA